MGLLNNLLLRSLDSSRAPFPMAVQGAQHHPDLQKSMEMDLLLQRATRSLPSNMEMLEPGETTETSSLLKKVIVCLIVLFSRLFYL